MADEPRKRTRRSTGRQDAESRLDALLSSASKASPGGAAGVLLIAAMEWDTSESFSSEGRPATDFFFRLRPFVDALAAEEDAVAKEIFLESMTKPDEQAMEEVAFLERSGVVSEDEAAALRGATAEDRKRQLFVALLKDSEEGGGEGEEWDEDGEEEAGEEEGEEEEDPSV